MEQFVLNQIKYGLKYLPSNYAKSYFIKKSNDDTKKLRKNGFICGVCHPSDNYNQLRGANIEWVRLDIPFPFNSDGSISEGIQRYRKRCEAFNKNGIKVMAITPYPRDYIEYGADIREAGGAEKICEIDRFIIEYLGDCVQGIQITNEMGIPHFTKPLEMEDAIRFVAVQLEALYPLKKDIILGYNSAGPQADLHVNLKEYHKYCDYVGVDIYVGCFDVYGGLLSFFDAMVRYLWALTKKPILIQEFGYISDGIGKTHEQKTDILLSYGAKSEADFNRKASELVENLPKTLKEHVKYVTDENPSKYAPLLFESDLKNHFYREMPKTTFIPGYPHTPVGQAKFFRDIISRMYNLPFVAGTIIYCYRDSDHCYICGQNDCPIETRWGLVDCNDNPKPSYNAVRDVYGKIRWLDKLGE